MLEKSSFKKSLETHFSRSKMFPIFTMHMMSIRDKKKLTNDFIEFHQFIKKEWTQLKTLESTEAAVRRCSSK